MNKNIPAEAFRKQFLVSIPAILNTFMMGCTNGWLPNAIYFYNTQSQTNLTSMQYFLVASSSEFGRLGASLPLGLIIDKFGTKRIILLAGIMNFTSWLILSLNSAFLTICVVRITLGMTSAMANLTSLIFIGEMASPPVRGKLTSICQTCLSAGFITQCIAGITFSSASVLSYCGLAFSSLFFVTLYWIIETPNYLLKASKIQQAKETLKRIRPGYSENDIDNEFEILQKYIEQDTVAKGQGGWLQLVTSDTIRNLLITAMLINLLIPASGRNVISSYVTVIYPKDGFVPSLYYPLIGEILQLLASVGSVFYIERLPRRVLLMVGNSLFAVIMAGCAYTYFRWTEYDDGISKWLFLYGNILSSIVNSGCVVPVRNAAQSEILPQAVKGFGGSLTNIAQAGGTIVMYRVYHVMNENFGLHFLYVVISTASLVLGVSVYFRLPEGRGRFLADVGNRMDGKA